MASYHLHEFVEVIHVWSDGEREVVAVLPCGPHTRIKIEVEEKEHQPKPATQVTFTFGQPNAI